MTRLVRNAQSRDQLKWWPLSCFLWHGYMSSFDRKCSSYYKEYCVHHKKNNFCHRNDFSCCFIARNIFLVRLILYIPIVFSLSQELFCLWERIVFLWILSHLRCITFLRQMRPIYNQNSLWDLRNSWEPGTQVHCNDPALPSPLSSCLFFWHTFPPMMI